MCIRAEREPWRHVPRMDDAGFAGRAGAADSVTIVGGGKRLDTVPFESHFGEEKLDEMMEWLNANTNFQLPTVEDGGADATVDVQTGEVSGPDDTAAPVEFGVQLGEPSKKTHTAVRLSRSRATSFSDGFGDDMPLLTGFAAIM